MFNLTNNNFICNNLILLYAFSVLNKWILSSIHSIYVLFSGLIYEGFFINDPWLYFFSLEDRMTSTGTEITCCCISDCGIGCYVSGCDIVVVTALTPILEL